MIPLELSVTDVPEMMAVLVAARDVVDRADEDDDGGHEIAVVPLRDMHRLRAALDPLMPGATVDE